MNVFNDYDCYYNAFYLVNNYYSEACQVDFLLKQYGGNVHKIINYGCGTGRHDLELLKLGYCCEGIDMSPLMIETAVKIAEKENLNIHFSVADIRKFIPERKYDAVISLFHVMSYQNTNDDILSVFRSARASLNEGGLLLFDAWYGPGVLSDKPCVRVREAEDENKKLIRIARPVMRDKENVVIVSYEVLVMDKKTSETSVIREEHSMRYWFRPEIEYFLGRSGFELVDSMDCSTLGETDYHSWTCYFIAKAV